MRCGVRAAIGRPSPRVDPRARRELSRWADDQTRLRDHRVSTTARCRGRIGGPASMTSRVIAALGSILLGACALATCIAADGQVPKVPAAGIVELHPRSDVTVVYYS